MLSTQERDRIVPVTRAEPSQRRASWKGPYIATLVFCDGIAVIASSLAAQSLRFDSLDDATAVSGTHLPYVTIALLVAPLWVGTMAVCGVYDRRRLGNGSEEYRRILNGAFRSLAAVAILSLSLKLDLARAMVAMALPLAAVLTVGNHFLARQWLHRQRAKGHCMQQVIVVGLEHQVADLIRHFRRSTHAGIAVAGACVAGGPAFLDIDGTPVRVLGGIGDVLTAIRFVDADTVAVAEHEALHHGALRRLGWDLEGTGVDLLVAPSVLDVAGPRIAVHPVAGLPLLHVEEPQLTGAARLLKNSCERVAAGSLLIMMSPFLLVIGLIVRATSRGPALFKQQRVGQGSRHFTLYKFRTMRVDAEKERAELTRHNEHDGLTFKMRKDPRLTTFGRHLRRFSLDEVPQLWNVVTGQMAIVGPRPPLPSEVEGYCDEVRRRLMVRPGLTGLWQVSGRANLPWKEAVRLDLYYVENWSLALDMVILAKTVSAVLKGRGAY